MLSPILEDVDPQEFEGMGDRGQLSTVTADADGSIKQLGPSVGTSLLHPQGILGFYLYTTTAVHTHMWL